MTASGVESDHAVGLKSIHESGIPENRELVLGYDRMRAANGIKIATRCSELITLRYLLRYAAGKSFRDLTQQDVATFLSGVRERRFESDYYRKRSPNGRTLTDGSLELHKFVTRKFMSYVHGCSNGLFPECVSWMKVRKIGGSRRIDPRDLLTPDEITGMVSCTEHPRDRFLISLLAESGARAGEVSTLRIREVAFLHDRQGFTLTLRGKTGERTIPLCLCEPDLKNWLNDHHPFKSDPDAPLFTSLARRIMKTNVGVDGIRGLVSRSARRAGIRKKVYPHLFRHTRATELARLGWNEVMLRQFFGWDRRSDMPATYIHLAQHDLQDYYLRMYGKAPKKENETKTLRAPSPCPHCGARNPSGYVFCFNCNRALSEHAEKRTEAEGILNEIVRRPDLRRQLDRLLEAAVRRKGLPGLCSYSNEATGDVAEGA